MRITKQVKLDVAKEVLERITRKQANFVCLGIEEICWAMFGDFSPTSDYLCQEFKNFVCMKLGDLPEWWGRKADEGRQHRIAILREWIAYLEKQHDSSEYKAFHSIS